MRGMEKEMVELVAVDGSGLLSYLSLISLGRVR